MFYYPYHNTRIVEERNVKFCEDINFNESNFFL
jgi:hypothetical protein